MKNAILLAALSLGCVQGPAEDAAKLADDLDLCAQRPCYPYAVFSPQPELARYVQAGADRIVRATGGTGVEPMIAEGGIPVLFQEDLTGYDEHPGENCGLTVLSYLRKSSRFPAFILIDPTPPEGCPPINVTIAHEMIHALAPLAAHSADGLFNEHASGSRLTESTLDALCEGGYDCEFRLPE